MKKFIMTLIVLVMLQTAYAEHATHNQLTLGFMPYLASQKLLKKYQPLADYLSKELHAEVVISVAKDYKSHLEQTGRDELDISFLGGSPYVVITEKYGPKPLLVRYEFNNIPHFRSVFFTRNNSKINSISDLKGKKVVFGSKKSTLSTQVPYFMLMQAGLTSDDLSLSHLNNHENVIISTLLGEYDAGASSEEVFKESESKGLRAIAYSPYLSTHVFVTSSKMDKKLQTKIKNALLKLNKEPQGLNVLKSIGPSLTGFVNVNDSDYNLLRGILEKVLPELEK